MVTKTTRDNRRSFSSLAGRPGRGLAVAASLALAVLVGGCEGMDTDSRPMQKQSDGTWSREDPAKRDTIFGKGGLTIFGDDKRSAEGGGGTGIGVNVYLWRAALDTVNFMPLSSADPFGGVIITDWYQPQASPGERFKVNLYILGRALRADALRASVFRQVRDPSSGGWLDAQNDPAVNTEFENAILTRARQIRTAEADKEN